MTEKDQPSLHSAKILVVEDEHLMRRLIVQSLNRLGFSGVLQAENGRQALSLLKNEKADIVFTDVEMKDVNGFDLVQTIRMGKTSLERDVPVIFLTGLSDVSTLMSASQLGVHGFLAKPVSANLLLNKIVEAFDKVIEIRPVESYEAMDFNPVIDDDETIIHSAEPPSTESPQPINNQVKTVDNPDEPDSDNTKDIDVALLAEGMRLLQSVYARGNLLIPADTVLVARHITVLRDMRVLLDNPVVQVQLSNEQG